LTKKIAIALMGYLCLTACTTSPDATQAAFLSGAEVRAQVVGHALSSTTKRGFQYTMHTTSDGTGVFVYEKRMGVADVPLTWEIRDDVFCFHSPTASECNRVRPNNGKLDFIDSKTERLNNTYSL
jgi:hypothetical protein